MSNYDHLSRAEKLELIKLREEKARREPILKPQKTNKPQNDAYNCKAELIGYGGAAGGGKSVYGLMTALYKSHYAVIIRRTLKMHVGLQNFTNGKFPRRLVGNPPEFKPGEEDRRRGVKVKQLRFAYLDHESDLSSEQGNPKDKIIIDEAVHLPWEWVNRLMAHNRPTDADELAKDGFVCQTILTFNPPLNATGLWIIDLFAPWVDPMHPMYPRQHGEILYYTYWGNSFYFYDSPEPLQVSPVDGSALTTPIQLKSITFFRADYRDNEVFRNNTSYLATLQGMREVERRAFLDGEMTASLVDEAGQIIRRRPWENAVKRWNATPPPTTPPLVVSIDIASGGDDHFVCMPFWKGGYAGMPVGIEGKNVPTVQAQVLHVEQYMFDVLRTSPDQTAIIYDASGGWGSGFAEIWRQKYPTATLVPFEGGKAAGINQVFNGIGKDAEIGEISGMPLASGPIGFDHRIGAAWYRAGEMLEHELFSLAVPPHNRLAREAQSRLVEERNGARISIESKEKLNKKLGHSPDYADAWVMGLWYLSVELRVRERKK